MLIVVHTSFSACSATPHQTTIFSQILVFGAGAKSTELEPSRNCTTVVSSSWRCRPCGWVGICNWWEREKQSASVCGCVFQQQSMDFIFFASLIACSLADELLLQYVKTGRLDENNAIDRLGVAVLQSERLTFIGEFAPHHGRHIDKAFFSLTCDLLLRLSAAKYKEFLGLVRAKKMREAASNVVAILTQSNMAPKW